MNDILIIAPHADDETLGCGGTLLRHRANGDRTHWLLVTDMTADAGYSEDEIARRENEISLATDAYGFESVHRGALPAASLDSAGPGALVTLFESACESIHPHTIYMPFSGDVHGDHRIVTQAAWSCTKWFRHASVKRVLAYETLSETEFNIDPVTPAFRPNVYVDISEYVDGKIATMNLYQSEVSAPPFPRSAEVIRAQALLRGSQSGFSYAEAFMLLKECHGKN